MSCVVRERLEDDPPCTAMLLYDLEGELFFGAAPELDRCFDELKQRTKKENIQFIVLRLKRTRNPDMVALERFEHFLHDMEKTRHDGAALWRSPGLHQGNGKSTF